MAHVLNTVHSPNNLDPQLETPDVRGMTPSQRDFWDRIEEFEIGDASWSLSFTKRLARENAWPEAFAARVVSEYKRFVFLMMEAGHPVTPSDEVDQAWHLHMVYTRSYWNDMCGELLGRALHHGPTKGGAAEGAKFEDWYARTLASYERLFGEKPPCDIWPDARTRFGRAPQFARVNTSENWVISKPRVRRNTLAGATLLLLAGGLAGCGVMVAQTSISPGGGLAVGAIVAAAALLAVGGIIIARRWSRGSTTTRRRHTTSSHGSGCSSLMHAGTAGSAGSSRTQSGKEHEGGSGKNGPDTGNDTGDGPSGSSDSGASGCSSSGCGGGGGGGCGGGGD
jgi:hypothetical protein